MVDHKYLIVGGGMAAAAAIKGIREVDPGGSIGLISAEGDPPYKRPPLSKGLWQDKKVEDIWYSRVQDEATLYLGRAVRELDARGKQAVDERGTLYRYD